MKVYVFPEDDRWLKGRCCPETIKAVLDNVAETTDGADLVVAVYLLSRSTTWMGEYLPEWLEPRDLRRRSSGDWSFVRSFKLPDDLPKQFKLIRLALGTSARYPKTTFNQYGWKERFAAFDDHLASLFAHELHHYRRYHLGLHAGEGEQGACKWGFTRAREAGFSAEGVHVRRRRPRPERRIRISKDGCAALVRRAKLVLSHLSANDLGKVAAWIRERREVLICESDEQQVERHAEALRNLPDGAAVRIVRAESGWSQYVGQIATKTRTLRRNSQRLAIRTVDGRVLHWPMEQLEPQEQIVTLACRAHE